MNDWELIYDCFMDPRFGAVEEHVRLDAATVEEAQAAGWQKWASIQPRAHARWEQWQRTLGKEAPRSRFGVMCPLPRISSQSRGMTVPLYAHPPPVACVHHFASV